jgi:predicted amidohydrolase
MDATGLTVAMITEVFHDDPEGRRLTARLRVARAAGAGLAVLPELPLDPWVPIAKTPSDRDAEEPGGPRHATMSASASAVGIALLGGAIVRDPETGRRHNTALLFGSDGSLLASYRKVHLPYERDFWEAAHYASGGEPPQVMPGLGLPIGVQICSDANRTSGCHLLAAQGASAVLVPRATPEASWPRWRLVLRADAVTSGVWLVSVNRPPLDPSDSPIGGPSVAIAPDGEVVRETTAPLAIVRLDASAVTRARQDYPAYLDHHPEVHARGWRRLTVED